MVAAWTHQASHCWYVTFLPSMKQTESSNYRLLFLPSALLATSPLVLMRALEMAFPLGMRNTFTIPPADSALSNSLHGHTAS